MAGPIGGIVDGMQLPVPATPLDPLLSASLVPSPTQSRQLDALSRALAEAADELAGRRSTLRSRAAALQWHSPAARAFGGALQELLGQLGQSSNRLAELSAAVRSHRQRAADRAMAMTRLASAGGDRLRAALGRMLP